VLRDVRWGKYYEVNIIERGAVRDGMGVGRLI